MSFKIGGSFVGFLDDRKERPWEVPTGGRETFQSFGHYVGKGRTALEVAIARSAKRPNDGDVRNLWKRRKDNRPSPLLLVVLWPSQEGERASVCGPGGDEPAVYSDRDPAQIARIAKLALDEPDHHAARRLVDAYLPEEGGVRNHSLFATHHLLNRVPQQSDWRILCEESLELLNLRREELVEALGFQIEPSGQAVILRRQGNTRAMALFLGEGENPEAVSTRFNGMTPVSWAIARATADNIPYVIVARGDQLRIHASRKDSAQRSNTFVELNLPLLTANDAGYLKLLFSAESLSEGAEFERLLRESHDFALGLGDRLRSRVYENAVPAVAEALIKRHEVAGGATDLQGLAGLYNRTLLVLFRLLFVAYAEDRGLLPLQSNDLYRQRSLKHLALELAELANDFGIGNVPFDAHSSDYWDSVRAIWSAIDVGRREWNVPPYNGGLFSSDADFDADGAALAEISLTNAEFGRCLLGLLIDKGDDGYGPVDFASLDVREFGTIYEGLLESDLALAPSDLTVNKNAVYVPAKLTDVVIVAKGKVYLHNKSGARKSSGSYFTKPFAVQHLLEHALEPALDEHLLRLQALVDAGDELGVAEKFFDFRCIDLSMGSGHFLVAAVDHIERRLSEFLAEHRVAGILDELDRLGRKSAENLALVGLVTEDADTSSLLRRQIAKRCIYGVDLNPTSVELARLALWIHTFVRGLPLTSLNHGLVVGNSLTGIGTVDEVLRVLDPKAVVGHASFVSNAIALALGNAKDALTRFAQIGEADRSEVKLAREAQRVSQQATERAEILFDLAVAVRLGELNLPEAFLEDAFLKSAQVSGASIFASSLGALHFPIAFPEVFMRERPGFDCIIGNPPWEEVRVEERDFFSLRFPGLKGMKAGEQKDEIQRLQRERPDLVSEYKTAVQDANLVRSVLQRGPFPGIGTGEADLYKAFAWRFWDLVREDGAVGVVLPRSALTGAGLSKWREAILEDGTFSDTTILLNNGGWVFEDVHQQYTVSLTTLRKGTAFAGIVSMNGPFRNMARYRERGSGSKVFTDEFLSWSEGASFPLLPSEEASDVFRKLHRCPRFDSNDGMRVRPNREFDSANDKPLMQLNAVDESRLWPVFGGRSFNIWEPDTSDYFAWADPEVVLPVLQAKRLRAARQVRSAFSEFDRSWSIDQKSLPCLHPRIAFRKITNRTNTRTVIAALIPPKVVLTDAAPYILLPKGNPGEEAYLLGVMCSIPFDWAARRVVEINLTFHLLNSLPLPRPKVDDSLRLRIQQLAGTLAAVDDRYADWASDVGVLVGGVLAEEHDPYLAELDAAVAHLYGLTPGDLRTIFSTFHEGWDFEPRLAAVLEHFENLRGIAQ